MEILGYLGIGKETTFGTAVPAVFHSDIASAGLDSPEDPVIEFEGRLSRHPRRYVQGAYISNGPVEIPVDVNTLWYLLWLMLGSISSDNSGITSETGEATAADSNGVIDTTLANKPVTFGSVKIYDSGDALIASDDGCGAIVEENASGVSGTINYATGALYATGVTSDEAATTDYDYGQYAHTITSQSGIVMPTSTIRLGKDAGEHIFTACALGQFELTLERNGQARLSVTASGGEDSWGDLKSMSNLLIPPESWIPFHGAQFKYADKDGTLSDISAAVDSITITGNNNLDAEGGLGLNSQYPQKIYCGQLDLSMELKLKFENIDHKKDFWGDASDSTPYGPQGATIEKKSELTLAAGDWGDTKITLPRSRITSVPLQPSGRSRIEQTVSLKSLLDMETQKRIEVVANSLSHYDQTY